MSQNLYITTTETKSGKSLISLGIMDILRGGLRKVAFFRPIINPPADAAQPDPDIHLIRTHFNLDMEYGDCYALTLHEAEELLAEEKYGEVIERVLAKYKQLEGKYDFILIEGTDFTGGTTAFEFDINADIANNLGAPVLFVTSGKTKNVKKNSEEILNALNMAIESFEEKGCSILGAIVSRVAITDAPRTLDEIKSRLKSHKKDLQVYIFPENETLGRLTIAEIRKATNGKVLFGCEHLARHAQHHLVAAMHLHNVLKHITEGTLVITPGDRVDIILGCLLTAISKNFPHIIGLVLTGGFELDEKVKMLIEGLGPCVPIISVETDTLRTVSRINDIDCKVYPQDTVKISTALGLFERHVDTKLLRETIIKTKATVVTPKMFEYGIIQKAKANKRHIVLPEGREERILQAAELLLKREVVDLTILGNANEIRDKISKLDLKLDKVNIIDPVQSSRFNAYVDAYYELRKHKGISQGQARDVMTDISYFGTMMVHMGDAHGMVSGSVNTTQHTVRPALEFIKTKPGIGLVSSVFFMCLEDRVLVYGDCAVNPNPDAAQLAEIAVASAQTAAAFGIEPRVAMLSYSTGESGKGADVEKVREAARIAREKAPGLKLEGPMQYDAAVDPEVARTKMPDSEVAGRATVFIFPDLNTGNNTYKAVQRSAKAVAIGPVLQGLNKPVNDLSRGCTVIDIVNTVAVTAIQALEE
ncbi:MAG: phosphate acetyltransferase [Nitrospinae bacterium]|nr:phosphate acetyltransferase [Nitrospinota bacterium]